MIEYLYVLDYEVDTDISFYVANIAFLDGASTRFGMRMCWEVLQETLQHQTRDFDDTMDLLMNQKTPLGIKSIQHGKKRLVQAPGLGVHALMYGVGDKYGIQGLKSTCAQKMTAAIEVIDWKRNPQAEIEEYATAVAFAYTTEPDSDKGLRTVMVDSIKEHVKSLMKIKEFAEIVEMAPQFAIDLIARLTEGANEGTPQPPWLR